MKSWILAVAVLALCAGPAWALEGQQWQCTANSENVNAEGEITCRLGHVLTLSWTADVPGGTFSDPTARITTYDPPENLTGGDVTVTLTVTGTCSDDTGIHGSGGVPVVVFTEEHSITIHATAVPLVVAMGDPSQLRAEVKDAVGPVSWEWDDGGMGAFEPSAYVADPRYWPSLPGRVPVWVSGSVEVPYPVNGQAGLVLLMMTENGGPFPDVPGDHWAVNEIAEMQRLDIVRGYPDGNYYPELLVDRGQMAVYFARSFRYLGVPDPVE